MKKGQINFANTLSSNSVFFFSDLTFHENNAPGFLESMHHNWLLVLKTMDIAQKGGKKVYLNNLPSPPPPQKKKLIKT